MKLQTYRSKHNMTQDYVAKKIRKHVTTVSKYETGDIVPSLDAMDRIAKLTEGEVRMSDFIAQRNQKMREREGKNGKNGSSIKTGEGSHIPSAQALLH